MRKIFILYFIILYQVILGVGDSGLSSLKTIRLYAKETVVINGEKKYGEYQLSIALPDKMKKIQSVPEMNKGEIYIYKKDEKIVYLPFFKQTSKEKLGPNENTIMTYLNKIIDLEKKDKEFRKNYSKNGSVSLINENGEKIILKDIKEFEKILFPTTIEVYDKGENIAKIQLEKIEINPKFKEDEFELESR